MNKINKVAAAPASGQHGEDNYEHVSPGLIYIETSCPGPGIDADLYCSLPKGCPCNPICSINTCSCMTKFISEFSEGSSANTLLPVYECNQDCICGSDCPNRVVQNGPLLGLKVTSFGVKGFGVMTEKAITKGTFVCEYAGEIIGKTEAQSRLSCLKPTDSNYILVLKEHIICCETDTQKLQITAIDPTNLGNIARYINHSCDPNLYVVPVRINSLVPVAALFTTRHVFPGEELCYDYNGLSHWKSGGVDLKNEQFGSESKLEYEIPSQSASSHFCNKPCLCSSSSCRKYLPSHTTNLFN